MKICIVCPRFPSSKVPDSIEGIFRYKYARILQKFGHEVFIVSTKTPGTPALEEVNGIKIFRVSAYDIPKIRYPIPVLPKLIKTILEVVNEFGIDVLEFNSHDYLTTLPIFFIRAKVRIPITMSVDGLTGMTYFYGNRLVDFVGLLHTFSLGKEVLKRADGIRLSHEDLVKHLERIGIRPDRLHVVHNAVDLDVFNPRITTETQRRELGIEKDDIVVLYVGRLDSVKGINYLIDVARILVTKHHKVKFVLVGEGTMRKTYQASVRDVGNRIIFTGLRKDIPDLMNAADVFVLPSLSEGCPNTVLEAAAAAVPAVSSNVGAAPEIIVDGETGFLVQPRNVEELKGALQTLIENPERAKEMGRKARQFVGENFNERIIGGRMDAFYRKVAENSRN